MKLSESTLRELFAYLASKKPLEEILANARIYGEQTGGDKFYVEKNDMETLLGSGDVVVTQDGEQYGGGYVIAVKIHGLRFVHVSRERWWKRRASQEVDHNPLSGHFGP